ncbi:MAG: ShlB/FhaC/HecB family hemolysin secretion/activation protein [Pseudomonadota bacterium]
MISLDGIDIRLERAAALQVMLLAAFLAVVLAGPKAHAQSAIERARRQADDIQRQQSDRQRGPQTTRPQAPTGTMPAAPKLAAPRRSKGRCFAIDTINVTGVKLIRKTLVRAKLKPFEGQCLDLNALNGVLQQITFLYVKRGYVTSRAYLPEQHLADGVLDIVVVEGKLSGIVINRKPDTNNAEISTAFPGLIGKPLNLRDIEQGLDQINRLRSNNATIVLEPGKRQGETTLAITNQPMKRWHVTLGLDNFGTRATGEYQPTAGIEIDNPLGINDRLTFNYQRNLARGAFPFSGDRPFGNAYSASYSIPYGYWYFSVDGSWTEYQSEVDGFVSVIDTSGNSALINLTADRVIHRDQVSKTSLSGTLTWKHNENFILGSRVDVSSRNLTFATLQLSHVRRLFGGVAAASVAYQNGLKIWGAFDDDTAPEGSPKGQFRKVTASLTFTRPFALGALSVIYDGYLSGQWTPDALFGSEQMSLGGYSSVRGVSEAELFGNKVILFRNELALSLPAPPTSWGLAGFLPLFGTMEPYVAFDVGHVFSESRFDIFSGTLSGAAVGLRNRGGAMSFDVSYADVIDAPAARPDIHEKGGLTYARISFTF